MGKRRPGWDYHHYLRYLKEGRGQGEGSDYKPWIYIHDFPSCGMSVRVPGKTTGRIHHLLSRNEEYYFYILDADPDVTDIREQFPLRLTETIEIARRMNIRHPWKGSFPFVMTTDFLITKADGIHARTVKCSGELDSPRVVEKFSIESRYWSDKGVDWKIVTERQIDRELALNLQWLDSGDKPESLIPDTETREALKHGVLGMVDDRGLLPTNCITVLEKRFPVPPGSAISIYKSLVLDGSLAPNLRQKLFF